MTKDIHIVFQVLNYLTTDVVLQFKLLPIDKFILILLAKHHGERGIFPRQKTLAREAQISVRHIRDRTKFLVQSGLISIKRLNHKYHYYLDFLSTIEEPQFRYQNQIQQNIEEPQFRSERNHSSAYSGTTVPTNNKEEELKNKTERARAEKRASLSDHFKANQETKKVVDSLELNEDEVVTEYEIFKIKNDGKKNTNKEWNRLFQIWLYRAAEYKARQPNKAMRVNEPTAAHHWFKPEWAKK